MTTNEWVALAALILGPNGLMLVLLGRMLNMIRKWDKIAWQHHMMWLEYARDHKIPANGEITRSASAGVI